jgi:subtilisin family serine protease
LRPARRSPRGLAPSLALAFLLGIAGSASGAGSVVSQGDQIHRADLARSTFGVSGRGVTVGVISDGIAGLDQAKASGDLPPDTCGPLLAGVTAIDPERCRGIGRGLDDGAEGTALMEIIHDLAPGAELLFCGPSTRLEMVACIDFLRTRARVIVDDLVFFNEPFFADGMVAQAAAGAAADGVLFVSAAGNTAQAHYQGAYVDSGDGRGSHLIGAANDAFTIFADALGQTFVRLQWGNEFGAAGDDYDLCLAIETPADCAQFSAVQDGDDDPVEEFFDVSGRCLAGCELQVRRVAGRPQLLELFVFQGVLADLDRVPADSVFGHPAVPGVVAVGAISAADPPFETVRAYSSLGPSTILFPALEARAKPDIVAVDGVSVTGAGGFFTDFFGTSAAAPNVAAIAALVLEVRPDLEPGQVADLLRATAVSLGFPVPNTRSGFGRADALEAVQRAAQPAIAVTPGAQDFGMVAVGEAVDRVFTVTNAGGGALTGTAVAAAPFSIVSGAAFDLGPGEDQEVVVRFAPRAAGAFAAAVTFASSGGEASVVVSGVATGPAPDLAVVRLRVRRTAHGRGLRVDSTVRNLARSGAAGPFRVDVYLSEDGVLDAGDRLLGGHELPGLGPHARVRARTSVRIPADVRAGEYHVIAVVNPADPVPDPDESNDTRASVRRVRLGEPAPPARAVGRAAD